MAIFMAIFYAQNGLFVKKCNQNIKIIFQRFFGRPLPSVVFGNNFSIKNLHSLLGNDNQFILTRVWCQIILHKIPKLLTGAAEFDLKC